MNKELADELLLNLAIINDCVDQLQKENERLRKALEFYASETNWRSIFGKTELGPFIGMMDWEKIDETYPVGGKRAREVLEKK